MSSGIPAKYVKPHYSTRLWRACYQYTRTYYDPVIFEEIVENLGVPLEYLLKDNNWISNEFFADFTAEFVKRTHDKGFAEKLGRFTPQAASHIELLIAKNFLSPYVFFLFLKKTYQKLNNLCGIRLKRARPGRFVYVVTSLTDVVPIVEVCENFVGVVSSAGQLFDMDVTVTHPKCIHRGNKECEFEVVYSAKRFWLKKIMALAGFGAVAAVGFFFITRVMRYTGREVKVLSFACYALVCAFFFVWRKYFGLLRNVGTYHEQSRDKSAELHDRYQELEKRYKELQLLNTLSVELSRSSETRSLIKNSLKYLGREFGYTKCMFMLLSNDNQRLYTAEVEGLDNTSLAVNRLSFQYPATSDNPQLFAKILERGQTTSIFEIEKFAKTLKPENQELLRQLRFNSIVVAPIQDEQNKFGLLVIGSNDESRKLNVDDERMIKHVGHLLSIAFQKAQNLEREKGLKTLFQKYVPAVVLDTVLQNQSQLSNFAARHENICSIFIDLRNFTSRCEKLAPERIAKMINVYSDYVTQRIAHTGGMIDKLVGDGLNAFFIPSKYSQNPGQAGIDAAILLLKDLGELDKEFQDQGFGRASIGIGVSSGFATIGNMGCDRKLDFTAVGDVVNLASRLQEMTKDYKNFELHEMDGLVIASKNVISPLKDKNLFRVVENVQVRGRKQSENIYLLDHQSVRIHFSQKKAA